MNFDQMRDLLLEQAFQGNLVPQLKEEPTIEPDSKVSGDVPFEIPKKWKWATLDDCVVFNPKIQSDDDADVSFIPMQACEAGYVNKLNVTDVRKWKTVKKGFSKFQDQDVLMAKITPCFQNRKSAIAENLKGGIGAGTTEFHVLRCNKNLLPKYLLFFLKSSYLIRYGVGNFKGTAGQQRIGTSELKNCAVPIPSLNEQRRIVAKLEESFAEIDRAEKAYRELQTLTDVLRKKILQEAVMGKLVPQLDGEPAVEQIGDAPEDVPFAIPDKWKWTNIGNIINYGKVKQISPEEVHDKTWILDLEDIQRDTGVLLNKKKGINISSNKASFKKGDVLYSKLRPYLNKVIVADEDGVCTTEIIPLSTQDAAAPLDNKYLQIYLMSPLFVNYAVQCSYGVKMPRLGTKDAKAALMPLPPLAEQRRILDRLNELLPKVQALKL